MKIKSWRKEVNQEEEVSEETTLFIFARRKGRPAGW
jgi:hypothetical protein